MLQNLAFLEVNTFLSKFFKPESITICSISVSIAVYTTACMHELTQFSSGLLTKSNDLKYSRSKIDYSSSKAFTTKIYPKLKLIHHGKLNLLLGRKLGKPLCCTAPIFNTVEKYRPATRGVTLEIIYKTVFSIPYKL